MLTKTALLERAVEAEAQVASACQLCAHACNRPRARGRCHVAETRVASELIHVGEEAALRPSHAIFFAGCNAFCVFCQAHRIARHADAGIVASSEALARRIERRRAEGARNVNFVGGEPTPHLPYILRTLAAVEGPITVVWNSNMYLAEPAQRLLTGVVDVYLADLKFGNDACARRLAGLTAYLATLAASYRHAAATAALVVRHLVLPGHVECCTAPALRWLASVAPTAALSLMLHYFPSYRARGELGRELTLAEREQAIALARATGLRLVA